MNPTVLRSVALAVLALLAACSASTPSAPATPPAHEGARAPAEDALIIGGTITLADGVEPKGDVFVSVKATGRPGPPLAAKKLPLGPFPLAFSLTSADRPMVNGPIPDTFEVKVTIDSDGNPMSKDPSDPTATVPAKRGQTDLTVQVAPTAP